MFYPEENNPCLEWSDDGFGLPGIRCFSELKIKKLWIIINLINAVQYNTLIVKYVRLCEEIVCGWSAYGVKKPDVIWIP